MILFPRKQDQLLSEEVNKSMETNKIIGSVFTETERQALWLASLKANTKVVYEPSTGRYIVLYFEEA